RSDMPVKVMAAPIRVRRALDAGIEHVSPAFSEKLGLDKVRGISVPHRVFHLGIDDLLANRPIGEAARFTGWRYLLADDSDCAIAFAEVALADGTAQFTNVGTGPFVSATQSAERTAETWARDRRGDFEETLLEIPGALCVAMWLRAPAGGSDA